MSGRKQVAIKHPTHFYEYHIYIYILNNETNQNPKNNETKSNQIVTQTKHIELLP